ncbi:MAG: IPT/TIG domain-containing protein [Polyangiaceae bacterium]|nr:IPT/TIG domain-containing protein [Polyangiaceae bacterium]
MIVRERAFGGVAIVAGAWAASCLARGEGTFRRQTDDDASTDAGVVLIDARPPSDARSELPTATPHAVQGVDPPHGPFPGGQLAIVRGNGFSSQVRIWIGGAEIPAPDVVPIDATRAQVVIPAGTPGPADVTTQNADDTSTRSTLSAGYAYDAFYLEPSSGPTSGGTVVSVSGQGTSWVPGTEVFIGLEPCADVTVASATLLTCRVPPAPAGARSVRVRTPDGVSIDALDAYTYGDSDNGFRGGLSGQALAGQLRVLALDNFAGVPIPGATVIADDGSAAGPAVAQTDASGSAIFQGPRFSAPHTVTIAKRCFMPQTFGAVPVESVTAYLDPVLSPKCSPEGDPPPVGGTPGGGGTGTGIQGELVWKSGSEFGRDGWANLPLPKGPEERFVAYVYRAVTDPTRRLEAIDPALAITPLGEGTIGYAFSLTASPGNHTIYALAGYEDAATSPPTFHAYGFGMARGVSVKPGATTRDVFISMDQLLEQALTVSVVPPAPTTRGPDRLSVAAAIRLADQSFLVFPGSPVERSLPFTGDVAFVGLPALTGQLAGATYVTTGSAATGANLGNPKSVNGSFAATTTSAPIPLAGFVEIPRVVRPAAGAPWDAARVELDWAPGGAQVDLVVIDIQSAGGLLEWSITLPGHVRSLPLPDLDALGPELGLYPGTLTLSVAVAHIPGFVYGNLRYRDLTTRAWTAHARDTVFAVR